MENRRLLIEFNRGIPKTQKEIEAIKKDFLLNDICYKDIISNGGSPVIDLNIYNIQTEVVVGKSLRIVKDDFGFLKDEIDLEYDNIDIDFHEEFDKALDIFFADYCLNFIKELDRKGIYTSENLVGFKRMKLKRVNDLKNKLIQNPSLEQKVKDSIVKFYDKIYEFTSNFKVEDYQISDKLKFKLNKNQVIWLFLSMYDKGVIRGITHSDLFRFLNAHCKYFDKDEYQDMSNSRIQANKFINGHASPSESIKVLNEKFDVDFFSSSS